nr:UvrD-helicase domain-containing protein [Paenisporosarcina quisquiliarum]
MPQGKKFNEENLKIIKSLESKDIIACPGSGKTTTLLAKIFVISNHFPLQNNQGICVITHTNVAIDEIKERLGTESNKLFEYPNFFGTIQSFVNQFLAIPYFQNTYGKNVVSIDDDIYNKEMIKEFYSMSRVLRFGLEKKFNTRDLLIEGITNLRFCLDSDLLVNRYTGQPLYKQGKTLEALKDIKKKIMEKGILCYDDAYWLAQKYLQKCEVPLQEIFSNRFKFLFIDEMQDTSRLQCEYLNRIFDKEKVIVQRFGDPNQSIYEDSTKSSWEFWDEPLRITNSKRNSPIISKMLSHFEIADSGMNGNNDIDIITPKILIFRESNINCVLPKFGQLIAENKLNLNPHCTFKAVGRIGKKNENGRLNITSYFPEYSRKVTDTKSKLYLTDFLSKEKIDPNNNKDVDEYKNSILNALIRLLWIAQIKKDTSNYFTKKSLLEKIEQENPSVFLELEENLFTWCLKIRRGEDITQEFINQSNKILSTIYNHNDFEIFEKFYKEMGTETKTKQVLNSPNIFNYPISEVEKLQIHLNTVAGVKGETHTATLFLETCYYTDDVRTLIDYFKGQNKKSKIGKREISALKHTYVAMSRPTHLLCIAAQKSSIDGHEKELKLAGWELIEL